MVKVAKVQKKTRARLHWDRQEYADYLFVGALPEPVATMSKRNKWWEGWVELPGVHLPKRYAEEAQMRAWIEEHVTAFFSLAQLLPPADDKN